MARQSVYSRNVADTNRPALTDADIAFAWFCAGVEARLDAALAVTAATSPAVRRELYITGARRPARRLPAAEARAMRTARGFFG